VNGADMRRLGQPICCHFDRSGEISYYSCSILWSK